MLKVPIEMPEVCSECFFLSDYETSIHCIDKNEVAHWVKTAHCQIAPKKYNEVNYADIHWFNYHKFDFCPLKESKR